MLGDEIVDRPMYRNVLKSGKSEPFIQKVRVISKFKLIEITLFPGQVPDLGIKSIKEQVK